MKHTVMHTHSYTHRLNSVLAENRSLQKKISDGQQEEFKVSTPIRYTKRKQSEGILTPTNTSQIMICVHLMRDNLLLQLQRIMGTTTENFVFPYCSHLSCSLLSIGTISHNLNLSLVSNALGGQDGF